MRTDFNKTVEGRTSRVEGQKHIPLSTLDTRHSTSHSGVALIITLILLSVVTIMAVTFLAISRRERGAVATVTDTAGARFAADAALANAEAQIMANVLASTNPFNFGLLVSTNYINPLGFRPGRSSFTNVNYAHRTFPGGPISQADFLQNLTNLWYSPRPPVFISTNPSAPPDFRYYIDLNRNGRFDPNDNETNYDNNGNPLYDASGNVITNSYVGDPEWIGVLERPDAPHGPDNHFIARYAFIALPIGNTLDLNAIHNQALIPALSYPVNPMNSLNGTEDGYFRNQGVGSWELNLAAFLADLNTNQWGQAINDPLNTSYYYYQYPGGGNRGFAFADAFALLAYRYANNYNTLARVQNLYGINGVNAFRFDNIDGYSDGPLQTTFDTNADSLINNNDNPGSFWVGADNTNHFFTPQELFNSNEVSASFVNRLLFAGQTNSTYDRYTFYRLLSQLGTDSRPDSGKMNLNYDNLDIYSNGVAASTNFAPWQPLAFFTNAADRLLRTYTAEWRKTNPTNFAATFYGVNPNDYFSLGAMTNNPAAYAAFGIGNIPVLVSNQFVYSPAVNRLLQLAANMYDATINNYPVMAKNYPSVFRPLFSRNIGILGTNNVFISGFTNVVISSLGANDLQLALPVDALQLSQTNLSGDVSNLAVNVYGVPWIVGAKKGFPNFNEFSFESIVQVTRKLEITRPSVDAHLNAYQTNQMYILSISNSLGVECWNSYSSNYTSSQIQIVARDSLSMMFTNVEPGGGAMSPLVFAPTPYFMGNTVSLPVQAGLATWSGSAPWGSPA